MQTSLGGTCKLTEAISSKLTSVSSFHEQPERNTYKLNEKNTKNTLSLYADKQTYIIKLKHNTKMISK